jgi:hypothetical protein
MNHWREHWCRPYFVEHSSRAISKHGTPVWKLYNEYDDAGKCASWLTKQRHGGCFVAGTPVTVSELPYSAERESSLWSETDWLADVERASSPFPSP